ncbi:MAG: VIT family protein [Devosia nanyangense]|uniref:VIT family protein n=1 Tax=Devosia nanyangense TaxID=1228055 RepID=A0A933NXP3_9HYPH|nr:VIT family protein [Devosia nanyangense]
MSTDAYSIHSETHLVHRIGWLRAAVLGANDGIVSTASILVGVASSGAAHQPIILAGLAGLVAGAMSMAAGEYVSVSSQTDTEQADLAREKSELEVNWDNELEELATIYERRGLDPQTAHSVARQLMEKDALGAHARDELGITEVSTANPIQAALTSAATFTAGAALPLLAAVFTSGWIVTPVVTVVSLIVLAVLGALGAQTGGASLWKGAARVTFWGAAAMAVTAGVGALFGTVVG